MGRHISFRIDQELYGKFETIVRRDGFSVSQVVRRMSK